VGAAVEAERRIRGTTPPGTPGVAPVLVENRVGRVEVPGGFTYVEPVAVSAVAPAEGPAGGGTVLSIAGTGFTPDSAVLVGTRPAFEVRVESLSRLSAVSPPGTPGPAAVTVVNRNGTGTRAGAFTYVPDLALFAIVPSVGPVAGGNPVRILGEGFRAGVQVLFGSVPAAQVTVRSVGEIAAVAPGAAAPGTVDVSVATASGAARLAGGYAYYAPGAPFAVHGVVPDRGPTSGGTAVVVVGGAFDSGVVEVRVGGTAASGLALQNPGALRVTTPPGAAGPADVTVILSSGAAATLPSAFHYEDPLVVTSVSPAEGPVAGGTEVEVRGEGFVPGATAFFGPMAALAVDVISPTLLRARTPPGPAGPVDLAVRLGDRRAVLPGGYTYFDAPRLFRISPDRGAIAGGTFVTLHGSGFTASSRLFFDGVPAVEVRAADAATLTARTPPGAVGPADVVVLGERGVAALSAAYTYFDPTSIFGGTAGGPVQGAVNVTVFDGATGGRVAGAFATLSVRGPTAYQGITDRNGQIVFSGPDLGGRQVLTAGKEGYSAATVVSFDAENITVILTPLTASFQPGPGPNLGTIRGVLKSPFKAIPAAPAGFRKAALVTSTLRDRFTPNPFAPGVVLVVPDDGREDQPFEIRTRLGDLAVYALAGHLSDDGQRFVPFQMGIHRYLFMTEGGAIEGVSVRLDASLTQTLDATLSGAPPLRADGPNAYRMRVFLELGIDGTVFFFQIPESTTVPRLVQEHLPVITGTIAGASFTVVAGAYNVFEGQEYSPLSQRTRTGLVDLGEPVDLGPMMGIASAVSPRELETLEEPRFVWALDRPPEPAFQLVYLLRPAGLGFVSIWEMILPGSLSEVRLPDLAAMAGLGGIPSGEVLYWVIIPVLGPSFAIDAFDYRAFDVRDWTSYSVAPYVVITP
jgi:hypothetical protein